MIGPHDPAFTDEKSVRDELTRQFDVCHGCRSCVDLCDVFPTLFDLIDRGDEGAGVLAPAEQDLVTEACHQCRRCAANCPYTPDRHELGIDVPRLMLRAVAMQRTTGQTSARSRRAARVLARLGAIGRAPGGRQLFGAPLGSIRRRMIAALTGVTSTRRLPAFARQTFSASIADRPAGAAAPRHGSVAVVPTCIVEFHAPEIGRDLVGVYERRGIECSRAPVACCGAVALHAGDLDRFVRRAEANVAVLADEVRRGRTIVVAQPTCCAVIRREYVDHVGPERRGDAELVAEHVVDAVEHVVRADPDLSLAGAVPGRVVYHVSSHLVSLGVGSAAVDPLRREGVEVELIDEAPGVAGPWGLRADHDAGAKRAGARLGAAVAAALTRSAGDSQPVTVIGDDHLANIVIAERTGVDPEHPLRLIARSDGISRDG